MRGRNNGPLFKRFEGLIFALVLLASPLWAAGQESLTLEKALEMVSRSSPSAELGALDEKIAAEKIRESLSLYYPKVDLSLGHVHLDNDPAFKFGSVTFPAGEQLFWKWDISIQQTIWDFGRRRELRSAAESSVSAVRAKVSGEVRMKQAEVTALFMEALTLSDQITVVESRKKSLEDHLETARNLFDQGVVTRNDVLRTEVALRSLDDAKRALESGRMTALDRLKQAVGIDVSAEIVPVDPSRDGSGTRIPGIEWSDDEMTDMALRQNFGLRALEEKISALEDAADFARKESYPYLVGAAGHSYEQNRYMEYPHVNKLFLGVSFNVFDGGARKARAAAAAVEVEKARREKLEAEREVVSALRKACRDYRDSLEEYATARLNSESSAENLRIVENQYREGLLRTTDFLEADALFAESRFKEVENLHRVISLEAAMLALTGCDIRAFFADNY